MRTVAARFVGSDASTYLGGLVERGLALTIILAISPVLALIIVALLASDGAPVMFRHRRIGLGGREFYCFKFRSMVRDAESALQRHLARDPDAAREWAETHKLKDDPRISRVGAFLRKTSLDELPQLLNVVRGEMSLVGPRPIVKAEIEKYGSAFRAYCSVKPGITGLWQISGRSDLSYSERVKLDLRYVRSKSVGLDLRILFATIPAVLLRRGSC